MLFTNPTAAAAVIFCHGSGDTGPGVREYLAAVGNPEARLRQSGIELHCPSAAPIPYRLAGGQISSVWFDRYALEPSAPEHVESIAASVRQLHALMDALVAKGIPPARIALGGFSMGGGIALQAGFRYHSRLGAVFALSSFACEGSELFNIARSSASPPPVFMRHGAADDFILPSWGSATAEQLRAVGVDVDFGTVPGLPHAMVTHEATELFEWVTAKLTVKDTEPPAPANPGTC